MSWAKFDDQYPDHPKIVEVGPLGMALHAAATCYCARFLTDGFIPTAMMSRIICFDGIDLNGAGVTTKRVTDDLIRVGLLEAVKGGFMVHDYLVYNPTAEQVKIEKAENAKRKRDWSDKHRGKDGSFISNGVSNTVSNGVSNASGNTVPSPSPSPSPSPYPLPVPQAAAVEAPNVFKSYESEIGIITKTIADQLIEAEETYPHEWIVEAFKISSKNNHRSWAYAEAILKRWNSEGKTDGQKHSARPKEKEIYYERCGEPMVKS